MFKKGQLVRSKETGDLFIIEGSGPIGSLLCYLNAFSAKKLPCGEYYLGRFNNCELIGNNYQPKTNTPAR